MDKNCEEFLENIQRALHVCKDNRITIDICGTLDVRQCKNVRFWETAIKESIPIKIEIKKPIITRNYSIDYKVQERSLIIE